MKFKVSAEELATVAKVCVKGLNAKDPHSQTLLKLTEEKDKLYIYCTTQKTFFKGYVPVYDVTDDEGQATEWSVDGNQLKTILSIIPSTVSVPVEFNMSTSARNFVIKVSGNTIKLPVFDTISPNNEEKQEKITVISANDFISKLSGISRLVSSDVSDEGQPTSCVHISFTKDKIKLMGTDGYTIGEIQIPYTLESDEQTILVPVDQVSLLSRTFGGGEDISLIFTDTKFGYTDEKGIVSLVSKSSLQPIPYEPVKARVSDDRTITIDSEDLKRSISALGKLAPISDSITMTVDGDEISLVNINEDVMKFDRISGTSPEDEITFSRNRLNTIENLLSPTVRLSWSDETAGRIVQFSNYIEDEDELDPDVFLGVLIND